MFSRITIIGLGMIGGSLGLAVRRFFPKTIVVGFDTNIDRLLVAQKIEAVHEIHETLETAVSTSDFVIIGTPIRFVRDKIMESARFVKNSALITDVGSTKQEICAGIHAVLPLANHCRFIGGHPIAGSEKSGPEHARVDLFHKKTVVLTPDAEDDPRDVRSLREFWEKLGAEVAFLSPQEHDAVFAMTSHLPHAVSSVLAAVCDENYPNGFFGTGFQSMTRLAEGVPNLWGDVFMSNRNALAKMLDRFQSLCTKLKVALEENDQETVLQILESGYRCRRKENDSRK